VSVLTIGTKRGVPQWVGNRINNIFKLSDILVNDVETVRNEGSTPDIVQVGSDYPLYVFKLNVEQPDEEIVQLEEIEEDENLLVTNADIPIVTNNELNITTA
jgi:hypothetical protein